MRILVELSAEHPTLPIAELEAVLRLVGGTVIETDHALVLADVPDGAPARMAKHLALTHSISAHWWTTAATPRAMLPPFGRMQLDGSTFAIRARRVEGCHPDLPLSDTVKAAGAALSETGKVDLKSPQIEIRMLVGDEVHVGAHVAEVDRRGIDARHPKNRAHFAPVSLHPRFARALANLVGIDAGSRVADPFVGTGGLLIEAGLLGARVYGGDMDPRMVAGTRTTLAEMGVDADVRERDVGELPEWVGGPLDAVISDPPYGRSSTTNREEMFDLYDRFFAASHEALRPGGRLGVIFPAAEARERGKQWFDLVGSHDQRVHKSMTRHWSIYEKRP